MSNTFPITMLVVFGKHATDVSSEFIIRFQFHCAWRHNWCKTFFSKNWFMEWQRSLGRWKHLQIHEDAWNRIPKTAQYIKKVRTNSHYLTRRTEIRKDLFSLFIFLTKNFWYFFLSRLVNRKFSVADTGKKVGNCVLR